MKGLLVLLLFSPLLSGACQLEVQVIECGCHSRFLENISVRLGGLYRHTDDNGKAIFFEDFWETQLNDTLEVEHISYVPVKGSVRDFNPTLQQDGTLRIEVKLCPTTSKVFTAVITPNKRVTKQKDSVILHLEYPKEPTALTYQHLNGNKIPFRWIKKEETGGSIIVAREKIANGYFTTHYSDTLYPFFFRADRWWETLYLTPKPPNQITDREWDLLHKHLSARNQWNRTLTSVREEHHKQVDSLERVIAQLRGNQEILGPEPELEEPIAEILFINALASPAEEEAVFLRNLYRVLEPLEIEAVGEFVVLVRVRRDGTPIVQTAGTKGLHNVQHAVKKFAELQRWKYAVNNGKSVESTIAIRIVCHE